MARVEADPDRMRCSLGDGPRRQAPNGRALEHVAAGLVDHPHRGLFLGDVQSDILLHGYPRRIQLTLRPIISDLVG